MSISTTKAQVSTKKAHLIIQNFMDHLKHDHDMEMQSDKDGLYYIEHNQFRVDFAIVEQGIKFTIAAPNAASLVFFKEEIAEHVSEVDVSAAKNLRWSGEASIVGELPPNFHILTVTSNVELHENLRRITLSFPDHSKHQANGIHLRLMMPKDVDQYPVWPTMAANGTPVWPEGKDKLHVRLVTISTTDTAKNEVSLDIVTHEQGLVSMWAKTAKSGDQVGAMGPAGISTFPKVNRYLISADMTAFGSITRLLKTVNADAQGDVLLYAPENFPTSIYLNETSLKVHHLADKNTDALIDKMIELTSQQKPDYAFYAGEFSCAQTVRDFFKNKLGLNKDQQLSVAYWRRNYPGYGS